MTFTRLKYVTEIGKSLLCDQLESNLIEYFNWGLLGVGGFVNVRMSPQSAVGLHRMRLVTDRSFEQGRVWEGGRQDWIWESGVDYRHQPIPISGVYVNGTFHPSDTTGVYKHYINYPHGRVVFDNPIAPNSVVNVEYSYRRFHFSPGDAEWFKEIMFNSSNVDDMHFNQVGSGMWEIMAQNRVQLPHVVVETVPRRTFRGKELGSGVQVVQQDVLFHIFAQNKRDRNTLLDVITYQNDKTILSFDKNRIPYPLTYNGSIAPGAMVYPQLVSPDGYFWKKIIFASMSAQEVDESPPLYRAVIRGTFELDLTQQ